MKRRYFIGIFSALIAGCKKVFVDENDNYSEETINSSEIIEMSSTKVQVGPRLRSPTVAAGTTASNGWNGFKPLEVISTTKVRSTFDGVKLAGKANQMEVGLTVLIGDFELQMGYRKAGSSTVPFTDYLMKTPVTINILNGGIANFFLNAKNTFEIYKSGTATYRYALNGGDVVEYVFLDDLPIKETNVATLTIGGGKFPKINYYPALEYESGGNYISAIHGRNLYGASNVGFEGKLQNVLLRDNEVNSGTSIAKTDYGASLW